MTIFEITTLCFSLVSLGAAGYTFYWAHKKVTKPQPLEFTTLITEQKEKIEVLEAQIATIKAERLRQGIVPAWVVPREDRTSYLLHVHNDSQDKAYNVELLIPAAFTDVCRVHLSDDTIGSDDRLSIYLFPLRRKFARIWKTQDLAPILFSLRYTDSPHREGYKTVEIPFTLANASNHHRHVIKTIKVDEDDDE